MSNHTSTRVARAGFTLMELLIVIAIITLLVTLLLPSLGRSREVSRRATCTANMRQMGVAHAGYSWDFKGYLAAFNGHPGLPENSADCADQARTLLNERLGRTGSSAIPAFAQANGTVPHHWVVHLMLIDHLGGELPMPGVVCPSDRARLDWRANHRTIDEMMRTRYRPRKQVNSSNLAWWPFSSSYQLMPAAWGADLGRKINCTQAAVCQQTTDHDTYYDHTCGPDKAVWGKRKIEEVAFPSQKVAMADEQQRHFGNEIYFAYAQAKQPVLFWDGSVSVRRTGDSRRGWDPALPHQSQTAETFAYRPDLGFESPTLRGGAMEMVEGHYKWTRGGLGGVDFGGTEVDTSRW